MDELVLISNENQKRVLWPIAKVIEMIPSKDGVIRVVRVKTAKGELQRPVKLLIPSEIRQNEDIMPLGIPSQYKEQISTLENTKIKKARKVHRAVDAVNVPAPVVTKITRSGRTVKQVQHVGV